MLPASIIFMNISVVILIFVNRRNWQSYLMIQGWSGIFEFSDADFYQLGLLTKPGISLIAAAVSGATFLSLFIIGDRKARDELKRRFHIRR